MGGCSSRMVAEGGKRFFIRARYRVADAGASINRAVAAASRYERDPSVEELATEVLRLAKAAETLSRAFSEWGVITYDVLQLPMLSVWSRSPSFLGNEASAGKLQHYAAATHELGSMLLACRNCVRENTTESCVGLLHAASERLHASSSKWLKPYDVANAAMHAAAKQVERAESEESSAA